MGIQLAVLEVAFTSTGAGKVQSDIAGVGASINEAGAASAGTLTTLAGASGLMADAFLGFSVKSAASFQTLMNTIQSNTTLSNSDMTQLASSVKSMAVQSGASMDQLGQAYMHTTNFGYSFADSQKIVTAAMQSAVSTGSNVGDTANVLAGAMKEFGISAADAGHAMDVLHESAATGNMTLEQLVDSSGKMLSTAANLHVPLVDVAAGMSALTEHGFTAANAGVAMTNMMTKIIAPSAGASKELAALSKTTGIDLVSDFTSAGLASKGMPAILDDIARATGGSADTLHKLFPELRSFQGALALTGTAAGDYSKELGLMNDAMSGKITPTADAYNRTLGTLGNEMDRLGQAVHVLAIDVGSVLLPPLAAIAGIAADAAGAIAKLADAHPQLIAAILAVVGALGTFIGGMAAFNAIAGMGIPLISTLAAALAPILVPLAAVAAAAAALYLAWQANFLGIRDLVAGIVAEITGKFIEIRNAIQPLITALGPAFEMFGRALSIVGAAFEQLFKGNVAGFLRDIAAAATWAGTAFGLIGSGIGQINWSAIGSALQGLVRDFLAAASQVGNLALAIITGIGELGLEIGSWLISQIAGIDWAGVGAALLNGLQAVGDFAHAHWVEILAYIFGGIPYLILAIIGSAIGWSTIGDAIIAAITAASSLATRLAAWISAEVAAIPWSDIWSGIQGAGDAIVRGLEAGGSIAAQLAQWLAGEIASLPWTTVWRGIQNAGSAVLRGLTAGANITVQLAQWLAGEIAALPWSTVWAGIQSAGGAILAGLEAGADITAQLAAWLGSQIAGINWTAVWGNIQSAGSTILSGLEAGADIAAQLGTWLGGEVGRIPWASVWANVQTAGSAIVNGLEAGANVAAQLTTWLGGEVGKINWQQVWANAKSGAADIGQAFSGIDLSVVTVQFDNLGTSIDKATSHNPEARTLIDNLKDAAGLDVSKLGDALGKIGDALAKVAQSPAAAQFIDQIGKSLAQLASAGGPAADIIETVGKALGALAAITLTNILSDLGKLVGLLSSGIPGAEQAAEGALQSLSGIIETVSSVVSGMVKIIDDLIHGDWGKAWDDAKTMVSGAIDGIKNIVEGFGTTLEGILRGGLAILKTVFTDAWHAAQIATTDAIGNLETIAGTIGSRIVSAIGDLGSLLFNIGWDAISGLAQGIISAGTSLITGAVKFVAGLIPSGVKGWLDSHSPSRVMAAIGQDASAGLALGLTDGAAGVTTAAKHVAKAATDGVAAAKPDLKTAAGLAAVGIPEGFAQTLLTGGATVSASAAAMISSALNRVSDASRGGSAQLADDLMGYIAAELDANGSLPSAALTRAMGKALASLNSSGLADQFSSFVTGEEGLTGEQFSAAAVATMAQAWQKIGDVNRGGSADSLAAFQQYVDGVIQATGELPTDAWVKAHETMWARLADTNRGGSAANAQAFFDYLDQVQGVLGVDLSPQAQAAMEKIWLQLTNTSIGGSQQLLGVFTQLSEDIANTLGEPLSDAASAHLAATLLQVQQQSGTTGVAAAQALIESYTNTFNEAPSNQIQSWIARQAAQAQPQINGYTQTPIKSWNPYDKTPAGYQLKATYDTGTGAAQGALGLGQQLQQQTGVAPDASYLQQASKFFDSSGQYVSQAAQTAAQQFNQTLAAAITNTGSVPSQAFDALLRTVLTHADDTATGGSQQLGGLITSMIAKSIDETGSLPSDAAVRTFGTIIDRLGDTLHGGSLQLATDFSTWFSQYITQNGQAPSDAMQQQVADLLSHAADTSHGGSQKVADQLLQTITAQMNSHGGVISESFLKLISDMFTNGEDKGKSAATIVGSDLMAALAGGIDSSADLPSEMVTKVLKKVGDDAVKTATKVGKSIGDTIDTTAGKAVLDSSGNLKFQTQNGTTPTVSPTDAATEAGKRLSEMFARGALAMQAGADMPSAADWFQRMALGQNPFSNGQQQPIEIHNNLYLDGEVVANQTQSVYAKQLRMQAPLVGAERIR